MSRRNWRILLTAVGIAFVVVLGAIGYDLYQASKQQQADYRYQPASKPGFRIDGATKAPTPEYKPNCQNPKTDKDADLCAQWAAVAQVSEANRLTSLNLRVSLLALFLTALGTGLLVWTLDETRETSRKELRAYVSVHPKGIWGRNPHGFVVVPVFIKNDGQTPTSDLKTQSWFGFTEAPENFDPGHHTLEDPESVFTDSAMMIAPHDGISVYITMPFNPTAETEVAIRDGKLALVHVGRVTYKDSFGYPHLTRFAHYHRGPELNEENSMRCPFGNDAT